MATLPSPGDVVIMLHEGVQQRKFRPFVVVSSDLFHATRPDVVLALLTSQIPPVLGPLDYALKDWTVAGLRLPTMFRAFFSTFPVAVVPNPVGKLTDVDWAEVQARLRLAMAV